MTKLSITVLPAPALGAPQTQSNSKELTMEKLLVKEPQIKIGFDLHNIFPFRVVNANNQVTLTQDEQPLNISALQGKIITLELKCDKGSNDEAQCQNLKSQYTASLNYKALCSDLADKLIAGDFCKIKPIQAQATGQNLSKLSYVSTWEHKIQQSDSGSVGIFNDFYAMAEELDSNMPGSLGHIGRSMTLLLPASHMPYLLAKTGVHSSALEMMHAAFPCLKFISVPELKTESKSFAMLVCSGNEYGSAGYFLAKEPTVTKTDDTNDKYDVYSLTLSEHKLLITHSEQIVVLEGI